MKTRAYIYFATVVSAGIATFLVGCGSQDKSTNAAPPGAGITCPLGSTLQNSQCLDVNGRVVTPTVPGTTGTGARFFSENWSVHNLSANGAGYSEFVQNAMGVCGPYTMNSDCTPWVNGAMDIVLMNDSFQSNQLTAVFRMKPFGSSPYMPPRVLPLNFLLSVTNNYQGFEARAVGDFNSPANRSLIQIQVATGKLEDAFLDYRIAYRGQIIITGRFQKCSSADCGLSKNIAF